MKIYKELEQGTDEWFAVRKGKITGSRVKSIMGKSTTPMIYEIIAELDSTSTDNESFTSASMQRGTELESLAIETYEQETFEEVTKVGFIECLALENLGVSPDGIIYENDIIKKGVEVKCPMTKTHVKYILENKLPSEYKYQVLLYFLVIKTIDSVDFVSYDPRFKKKPLHVINITRAEMKAEIEKLELQVIKFNADVKKYQNQII